MAIHINIVSVQFQIYDLLLGETLVGWQESLIDNVLSVSGTDYQDIGALGRTKSSKNIAQTLTPCQPFGMVGSLDGRTGKKSCSRAENDEIL